MDIKKLLGMEWVDKNHLAWDRWAEVSWDAIGDSKSIGNGWMNKVYSRWDRLIPNGMAM